MATKKETSAAVPGPGDPNKHKMRKWAAWMKECPECSGELFPIKLFERGANGEQREVEFGALADPPETGWFTAPAVPVMGVVRGGACQRCARVQLFAIKYSDR
jgi:hypothetical protein